MNGLSASPWGPSSLPFAPQVAACLVLLQGGLWTLLISPGLSELPWV